MLDKGLETLPIPAIRCISSVNFHYSIDKVVRELIENAIDAESTTVQVNVDTDGSPVIIVADNGFGIKRDNMSRICEFYTTTKCQDRSDLASVRTIGFKGVALAHISCISDLVIKTRHKSASQGFRADYSYNVMIGQATWNGRPGTTVEISNVLSGYPEMHMRGLDDNRRVVRLVEKYAIAHSAVAFTLVVDGAERVRSPGCSTSAAAMRAVLSSADGPIAEQRQFRLSEGGGHIIVSASRTHTTETVSAVFVNGRLVHAPVVKEAMRKFTHSPFFVVLQVPAGMVQVPEMTLAREKDVAVAVSAAMTYGEQAQPVVRPVRQTTQVAVTRRVAPVTVQATAVVRTAARPGSSLDALVSGGTTRPRQTGDGREPAVKRAPIVRKIAVGSNN